MSGIDEAVEAYLDCKRRLAAVKGEMEEHTARVMELVKEAGGAHETPSGVKVKYTPASVNERFDWKAYLKEHPEARAGYMVSSLRKESVRVTVPKKEELDEYGWEA